MNRKELIDVFQRIDDALSAPQTLCVIGASAVLAYGHSVRQTDDIDVWRPASRINDRQIARAAEAAGIVVDRGTDLPEGVYMQLIEPGVVQLPAFRDGVWATGEARVTLWEGDRLTVEAPPPSVVVAAKLVRAEDRDIDDCVYLVRAKGLSVDAIMRAIGTIPHPMAREAAAGNLVLLQVVVTGTGPALGQDRTRDDGGTGR